MPKFEVSWEEKPKHMDGNQLAKLLNSLYFDMRIEVTNDGWPKKILTLKTKEDVDIRDLKIAVFETFINNQSADHVAKKIKIKRIKEEARNH